MEVAVVPDAEELVLVTTDGERLAGRHLPRNAGGPKRPDAADDQDDADDQSDAADVADAADARALAVVVAHGFTGTIDKPPVRAVCAALARHAGVVAFDFRGHGRSSGASTLGDREVLDVEAAVRWARAAGYDDVVTCGWSMGGSVVLRHAALHGGVDGVVSVSAVSRWFYRDTVPMRRVHWAVETRVGRLVARHVLKTRISSVGWSQVPESPVEVVGRIAPTPLLVVHGDADHYFPLEHPQALFAAAGDPKELWLVPGFGHAENGASPELLERIGAHLTALVAKGR